MMMMESERRRESVDDQEEEDKATNLSFSFFLLPRKKNRATSITGPRFSTASTSSTSRR